MSPTTTISIPTIDPSRYAWYTDPTTPGLYRRCALGLETKWVHRSPQNRQLFLSGVFTFHCPMSSPEFRKAVARAWLRLRFEFPEVVLRFSGEFDADGSPIMECKIPSSETEAEEWAAKTLYLGDTNLDVQTGPNAESQIRMEVVEDPVCARLNYISRPKSHNEPVFGAEFCFRVDHQLADGMGVYILTGNFLRILAKEVSRDKDDDQIEWEKAVGNIPEPWVLMMNAKQKTEGKDFEERATKNTELVLEAMKSEWGLRIISLDGYKPMSIQRDFSSEQSKTILRSVKTKIGPEASVTQLGHAAMAMTLLKYRAYEERVSEGGRFVSPLFMSGRRYLNPERPRSTYYVPMCRAIGAIEFREAEKYVLLENDGKDKIRMKLKRACEEARRSYQAIREQESLLTDSFATAEFMGTAKNDVKDEGVVAPLFLSDGIAEQYVARSYTDQIGSAQILSVDDLRFKANPDGPPLIIRMYTFRDIIKLVAEWNAVCYAEEIIQCFLDDVFELMLVFCRELAP